MPEPEAALLARIEALEARCKALEQERSQVDLAEQKYRSLVESIPDSLVVLDHDLNHVLVNEAAVVGSGMSREALMQTNPREMFPDHHEHPFLAVVGRVLETRQRETVTAPWVDEGGRERWIQLSVDPVPDGVLFISRDISEYKAMEARLLQAQKMEAIGTLAGGIAHDFNNLLTAVQGHVALIGMDLPDEHPCLEHCAGITEIVQSAASLTQQLLGFARGGKYQVQPTDANALLVRTTTMFARTRKQLEVHTRAAEDLWTVNVDRVQLEQVILNLLVNAWEAMPEGGDLFVETRNADLDAADGRRLGLEPGRYVRISVRDTGVGMDAATLGRVFEPFFTTREKGRGTGLGMASSYGIIRNHGGMLTADSEPGRGSTFDIFLPASSEAVRDEEAPVVAAERGSETVLVIDDEAMVRKVTSRLLERLGYRVWAASTGAEGVAMLAADPGGIDLVILDMILPGESPSEILAGLRRESADVKVLLCSGYSVDGDSREMLELGCQGFLQKPFQMGALAESVRKVLEQPA